MLTTKSMYYALLCRERKVQAFSTYHGRKPGSLASRSSCQCEKETELPKPTQTQCEGCRKKFQEGCCRRKRSTTWWKIVVWKKSEIYQLLAWNIDYGSTHWIITDSRALPLLGNTKVESCVSKRKPNLRLWSRECGSCYTTAFYWRFPFVRTGRPDHCRIHRVFAEKPPLSCILFRIWLIWLDSFH